MEYRTDSMTEKTTTTLHEWLDLLNPEDANIIDKLKIIVINPPSRYRKDENDDYVDVAEENARRFATSISDAPEVIKPYLLNLLQGEQKQSNAFGYQLALEVKEPQALLDNILAMVATIADPNINLLLGVFRGIQEKSVELWERNIERLTLEQNLTQYYPRCILTGRIKNMHLQKMLELISKGILLQSSANFLSYGNVT